MQARELLESARRDLSLRIHTEFRGVSEGRLRIRALARTTPPQAERLASASRPRPVWGFLESDIPVEPEYRFGRLPSGMRYVIRRNANPKGTAMVRMEIAAGSLDEAPAAHHAIIEKKALGKIVLLP